MTIARGLAARRTRGLVSAIMPAYNARDHIRSAIGAIVEQTHANWELVVVDDGSTDGTPDVVASIDDPRIVLVRLSRNYGRPVARNEALRRAKGQFIAICDSDDLSQPRRFEVQAAYLAAHPETQVVSSQVLYFGTDAPPIRAILYPEGSGDIERQFRRGRCAIANQAAMIRGEAFDRYGGYRTAFRRAQDFDFFLRLPAGSFATLTEPLVWYRHTPSDYTFRYFAENARYTRYATYIHQEEAAGRVPLTLENFCLRARNRLLWLTADRVRFRYVKRRLAKGTYEVGSLHGKGASSLTRVNGPFSPSMSRSER